MVQDRKKKKKKKKENQPFIITYYTPIGLTRKGQTVKPVIGNPSTEVLLISIKRFLKSPKSLVKTKIKLTTEDTASDKTS